MYCKVTLHVSVSQHPSSGVLKTVTTASGTGHNTGTVQLLPSSVARSGRLPKEVMKWSPPGRGKRGRPKLTWAEGIRGLMGEKGLMEEDCNDRDNWRKKII